MKFVTQAIKVTPENHTAVQQKLREQGYKWINGKEFVNWIGDHYPFIGTKDRGCIVWVRDDNVTHYTKQLTAEEFLNTMKPFYIYTPTLEIMQSVQQKLNDLGYKLNEKAYFPGAVKNVAFKTHYPYIHVGYNQWGQIGSCNPGEDEISLKELFSEDFPRYAEPGRHIPKGELLPDYEVVVKEKEIKVLGLGITIPVESVRNLAAALAAQPERLKNVYIHAPGPELMQFVYDKLRSLGYSGFVNVYEGSYIGICSDFSIGWNRSDDEDWYAKNIWTITAITTAGQSTKSPALPDLAGHKVSLENGRLKIGCQELSLESFNNFVQSL